MTNEGAEQTIEQIGMLKDGSAGIEHNPNWGDVYKDIKMLYARSGTFLTPALQEASGVKEPAKIYFRDQFWKSDTSRFIKYIHPTKFKSMMKNSKAEFLFPPSFLIASKIDAEILHLGGKISLGSHGEDQGMGVHNEIWALQMGGMTNFEALKTGTINAAMALGIHKDLGSIEPGKIADLIVLKSNPLDDIHYTRTIRMVIKNGVVYDHDLNMIWPKIKSAPSWNPLINNPN